MITNRTNKELACFWDNYSQNIKYQGQDYLKSNHVKFLVVYNSILKLYFNTDLKVLSIGAGSAYVEAALSHFNKAEVTIIDFPEILEHNKEAYKQMQFKPIAKNILNDSLDLPKNEFNIIIACDILEHLPVAPSFIFNKLKPLLIGEGHIIITTPNLGRLENLRALLKLEPIFPSPIRYFSEVCAQNEDVHRREYLSSELVNEFKLAGFAVNFRSFFNYKEGPEIVAGNILFKIIYSLLFRFNKRFHSCICMIAQKQL